MLAILQTGLKTQFASKARSYRKACRTCRPNQHPAISPAKPTAFPATLATNLSRPGPTPDEPSLPCFADAFDAGGESGVAWTAGKQVVSPEKNKMGRFLIMLLSFMVMTGEHTPFSKRENE